jgi:hypothetical protein
VRFSILVAFTFIVTSVVFLEEGHVAQVHLQDQTIEDVLSKTTDIVVVKSLSKKLPFYSVTFPKSTHYEKKQETIYEEQVELYEVIEVLKSESLKRNQQIKVWSPRAYGESEVQFTHEYGGIKSVTQPWYEPKEDLGKGAVIIFLTPYSGRAKSSSDVWENVFNAREGLKFKNKLMKLIPKIKTEAPIDPPPTADTRRK